MYFLVLHIVECNNFVFCLMCKMQFNYIRTFLSFKRLRNTRPRLGATAKPDNTYFYYIDLVVTLRLFWVGTRVTNQITNKKKCKTEFIPQ